MQADFWTQNWASFLDPELGPFCGPKLGAIFWTKKLGYFFFRFSIFVVRRCFLGVPFQGPAAPFP